jgi:hypothetical protein
VKTTWARRVCSHHALCGISHPHLARLVNELAAPWTARHEASLEQRRGGARQRATGAGPNHHLVFADRLLVTLVVLRFQLPHKVLAVMFGVDRSTVTRAVHEVRPLLAQRGFAVPDRPGLRLKTLADVFADAAAEGLTLRIDGTEVQVRRPRANRTGRKAFVSGKQKQNTIKPTVVGDGDGRMLWAGATRPGRMHDATAVRTEGIEDLLGCHPQVKAEVDSGSQGLARDFPDQISAPPQKPAKGAPSEQVAASEQARKQQSSRRISVEHTIAAPKQWRPLQRYIGRREYFDETFQAIAGLVSDRTAVR